MTKGADLILFAGARDSEAYIAFGASHAFRTDPIVIVPWEHSSGPGRPLAWWHCPDWGALMGNLRRVTCPRQLQAMVRSAIDSGGPALVASRNAGSGPIPGTPANPALQIGRASCRERVCQYV